MRRQEFLRFPSACSRPDTSNERAEFDMGSRNLFWGIFPIIIILGLFGIVHLSAQVFARSRYSIAPLEHMAWQVLLHFLERVEQSLDRITKLLENLLIDRAA